MSETMHYFKAVNGRACPRYGSDSFIGCRRGPKGFVWAEGAVVAIPDKELAPNRKAYRSALRHGDLLKATEVEYNQWLTKRREAGEATAAAAKKQKDFAAEKATAAEKKLASDEKKAAKKLAAEEKKAADEAAMNQESKSAPDGEDERAVG